MFFFVPIFQSVCSLTFVFLVLARIWYIFIVFPFCFSGASNLETFLVLVDLHKVGDDVCDTAVIDTGLRRSGVSYLGFLIVWRGIIVPGRCSSAVGVSDLSGSVGQTVQLGRVTILVRGESL